MHLTPNHIQVLNIAMRIMEIRTRFCQYGIMTIEEYQNAHLSAMKQPLVYDPASLDDDAMFTVCAGYDGHKNLYFEDIHVRYLQGDTLSEDLIEVAVPVVLNEDCQMRHCAGKCNECPEIAYHQLYLIGRNGCIYEDTDMDGSEDHNLCCNCGPECEHTRHHDSDEYQPSAVEMMRCRESGAHHLCHCECGEEHCFVECGPVPDENCECNENGRCHCPHNKCCGCDCKCECTE